MMLPYREADGFEWDSGNLLKVWDTHKALPSECQQLFANNPFGGRPDEKHSADEKRNIVYGKTNEGRLFNRCIYYKEQADPSDLCKTDES